MTSRFEITDDDSGEDLTHREHFELDMRGEVGMAQIRHYLTIDQVARHLMTDVFSSIREITIRRKVPHNF